MSDFLEAIVALLPAEVGGRAVPIEPREGSYRPFARAGSDLLRMRVIEGPPRLGPGDEARVLLELESSSFDEELVAPGAELDLLEHGERRVGILSILRLWRSALSLLAAPLFLLFLGCSSGAGVTHDTLEGGEGSPIDVRLALRPGVDMPGGPNVAQTYTTDFDVEVSNNSDADVVVERISLVQPGENTDPFRVAPAFGRFKELIEPGNDHLFVLRSSGRQVRVLERGEPGTIVMKVVVSLQSGDQYSWSFDVAVPMQSR